MTAVAAKRVYLFEEGDKSMRDLSGRPGRCALVSGSDPLANWKPMFAPS